MHLNYFFLGFYTKTDPYLVEILLQSISILFNLSCILFMTVGASRTHPVSVQLRQAALSAEHQSRPADTDVNVTLKQMCHSKIALKLGVNCESRLCQPVHV